MDDKNDHAEQKNHKKDRSRAEVVELNDGSFAIIIPERFIESLGWSEGEELKIDFDKDKISVSVAGQETDQGQS